MSDKWTDITLGDLVNGYRGVSYQPSHLLEERVDNSVILLRANNIQNSQLNFENIQIVPNRLVKENQLLKQGDIAVCMSNGSKILVGKAAQYEDEQNRQCTIGAFCSVFKPKKNTVKEFIRYLFGCQAYQRHIDISLAGSAINNLKNSDIEAIAFTVPSEKRQRKIASILTSIDQTIEKTEALIHKYQQIKAGLMHDLFTRGLTADGKLRPPREQAPELYQETPIGWIPKEWKCGIVRDHGAIKLGRQRSPDKHSGKWTTPYLRVANVFDGFINFSDVLEMDFTPNEKDTFYVKYGDILLNEGQSLELVGRSSVYLGEDDKYCFQNTLVRFRCYRDHAPLFYGFLFKWWLDIGLFMQISKQTTSVAHLGADRFAKMLCPVLHYNEQLAIAERLSAIQKRIDCENSLLLKYQKQKSGLMHDLLTGKVPVKVDQEESAHG